ncbi:YqaA family protein [Neptunomonas antarctica]|uniref:Membrane protein YqaA, SNARE-associated domain n=1 Tax=Neptunomonas antarctica TaxID=619304 RepID=A0A1N7K696_9GAMM|nr:YqaA family protein [Neptunomonas antarctica]SIS57078.1 membrane protein YqaA, SNARE-associated domain [Neptunomonas antarctica]
MEANLLGLFFSSLISSTLLPGGSEAYLAWLVSDAEISPILLVSVATIGNTLGGMITYGMGRLVAMRYPLQLLNKPGHERAKRWFEKAGSRILLFSWLPVVGDPLCFVAGWLKINALAAVLFVFLGKAFRYMLVVGLFS